MALTRICALVGAALLAGCAQSVRPIEHEPLAFAPWSDAAPAYRLGVGDRLKVDYLLTPELNQDVAVEPDGTVSLRVAGRLAAQNLTTTELEAAVQAASARRLRQPVVSLSVTEAKAARIIVGGAVERPGVYPLAARSSVLETVMQAGGFSRESRMDQVVVLRMRPGQRPMLRTVDLSAFVSRGEMDAAIALASEDIVFVPRSRIAELNLWVEQYVDGVLPFSRSVNYSNSGVVR